MINYQGNAENPWVYVWGDEFTGTSLGPQWATSFANSGGEQRTESANNEAEYYCDPNTAAASSGTPNINPFSFPGNSTCVITAAPSTDTSDTTGTRGLAYSSGMLASWKNNACIQAFGRWEIRVAFSATPSGAGFWPAFWLLPVDVWPPEIDAFEIFLGPNPSGQGGANQVHTGIVGIVGGKNTGIDVAWRTTPNNPLDGAYHTYTLEWDSRDITWHMDGEVIATAATPELFEAPMYVISNLAVGQAGAWPGAPVAGATAKMMIDYVRVFSCAPDAVAAAWPGLSSPDGADTSPVGVMTASGPLKVGTGQLVITGAVVSAGFNPPAPAEFTVQIDGVQVGGTHSLAGNANASPPLYESVTIEAPLFGAKQITITLTNSFWAPPTYARALAIESIAFSDSHNVIGTSNPYAGTLPPVNAVMPLASGNTLQSYGLSLGSPHPVTFDLPPIAAP